MVIGLTGVWRLQQNQSDSGSVTTRLKSLERQDKVLIDRATREGGRDRERSEGEIESQRVRLSKRERKRAIRELYINVNKGIICLSELILFLMYSHTKHCAVL